jgi:endoglucanase
MGSVGTPYSPFRELAKNKLQGKAFDDRSGVNILWELIERLSHSRRKAHLAFSFSVQEEVGLRGAGPAFFATEPTLAIAVENTTAGDTPGIAERYNPTELGKGPAITLADKGLLASQQINEQLAQTARRHDIPFQWKRPLFGGTNAGRIHSSGRGVATSVVSVPARYIHSPTTVINTNDLVFSIELLQKFIDSV